MKNRLDAFCALLVVLLGAAIVMLSYQYGQISQAREVLESNLRDQFELRYFIKPVRNVKEGHYSGLMVGSPGQPDTPVRYQCSYEGCEFECGK